MPIVRDVSNLTRPILNFVYNFFLYLRMCLRVPRYRQQFQTYRSEGHIIWLRNLDVRLLIPKRYLQTLQFFFWRQSHATQTSQKPFVSGQTSGLTSMNINYFVFTCIRMPSSRMTAQLLCDALAVASPISSSRSFQNALGTKLSW